MDRLNKSQTGGKTNIACSKVVCQQKKKPTQFTSPQSRCLSGRCKFVPHSKQSRIDGNEYALQMSKYFQYQKGYQNHPKKMVEKKST